MPYDAPDTLACALQWLQTHADLPPELQANPTARVSTRDRGKYPCLRVQITPAGGGGLLWQTNTELMLEVLDTPKAADQLGDSRLLAILQRCLRLVYQLADADQPLDGRHEVVTAVGAGLAPAEIPDPSVPGQPRWLATVSVNAHPAA